MENNMNAFEMNEESLENVIGGAAKPTKSAGEGYKWYQIKHGDTLIKIAKNTEPPTRNCRRSTRSRIRTSS